MKKSSYESQAPFKLPSGPLLIVLSGPSGAGKDAVLSRMKELGYPLEYITTVTTRPKRAKETDGVDYYFFSAEKFQEMLSGNELLEWAKVYGNWYGVPRQPVEQALDQRQDVIVKVDIQGAATIKKIFPQTVSVFLIPPVMKELISRLKQRHTESPFDLTLRINTAEEEIKQLPLFDYAVCNRRDDIDRAVSDIKAIIQAEKCRVNPGTANS
jgi:guanylate kinase